METLETLQMITVYCLSVGLASVAFAYWISARSAAKDRRDAQTK